MKVFNLGCSHSHVFEGWFGSESDYQSQLGHGMLECPVCGDRSINKLPSAPRLNLLGQASDSPFPQPGSVLAKSETAETQALLLRAMRELNARAEDVGDRFADEARRIHQGDATRRDIKGRASLADAVELLEEGISVLPLPDLPALKETLQ